MKKLFLFLLTLGALLCEAAPGKLTLFTEPVDGNILAWKGYRRLFHSVYGSPCNLTYVFFVPAKGTGLVKNSSFTVFVPDGVRVEEILPQYANNAGLREVYDGLSITKAKVKGGTRYTVSNMDPFLKMYPNRSYTQKKELSFYFEQEKFDPAKEYKILYQWTNAGKKMPEEHFILKFLPPVPKKPLPKKVAWQNFVQVWQLNVRNEDLLKRIIVKYRDSNTASRALDHPRNKHTMKVENFLRKNNWQFYENFHVTLLAFRRDMADGIYIKESLLADGTKSRTHHCPTAALKNRALIEKAYPFNKPNLKDGDILALDNEPFHYWKYACFCSECLDAFAKEFKIDRKRLSSPKVVQSQFEKQWLRFLCLHQYRATKIACDRFLKKFPKSKVVQYNYLLEFDNPATLHNQLKGCPQDPRDFDNVVSCHTVSVYSCHGADMVKRFLKQSANLKKPVSLALGMDRAIGEGSSYMSQNDVLTPKGVRLKTLVAAAGGGTCILSYAGIYFDGWMFHTIAQAMHEIAAYEDYYIGGGKNAPLSVMLDPAWDSKYEEEYLSDSLSIISRSKGSNTLGTVFNFHATTPSKVRFRYTGPLKKFYVSELHNGKSYQYKGSKLWTKEAFNKSFTLTIAPEDAAFILISATDPLKGKKSVFQADMREQKGNSPDILGKVAAEKKFLKGMLERGISSRAFHGSSVKVSGNNIVISTPSQEAVITLNGALMTCWKNKLTSKTVFDDGVIKNMNYAKGSVWSVVEPPHRAGREMRFVKFRPYNLRISDEGKVEISFGYMTNEYFLYKTLDFSPDKAVFTVRSAFRNLTPYSTNCAMRFRMCLALKDKKMPQYILGGKAVAMTRPNNHFAPSRALSRAWEDADYRGPYSGNTLKGLFNGSWITLQWNARDIQTVLVYQDRKLGTMELITPVRKIFPLKEVAYNCTLSN